MTNDSTPAALHPIAMSAANTLAVYPQLARAFFNADSNSPEVVDHYAEQPAQLIGNLRELLTPIDPLR